MPEMIDPHEGYLSFREEVKKSTLPLEVCKLHPDVKVHVDMPDGEKHRYTFTILEGNTAKGILIITPSGWDGDIFYYQIGFAVAEEFRRQGVGEELCRKGLEEFLSRIHPPKGKKIGIEAIISTSNTASQKLAAKIFANPPTPHTDKYSGEDALLYEFIVEE